VSIVTPSLNSGRYIAAAIESVRAQDYPRIEHLVVDGGSVDETHAVLARYSPPLRWVIQPRAGQSAATNHGFHLATGQILSWLNADDALRPGAVRAVVEHFRADPGSMMVYGLGEFVDASGLGIEPLRVVEPFNLARLVEVHNYVVQPAAFLRREALEAVGYLDETLHWSMDWDLWIRIGQRFTPRFLPILLATVRLHHRTKTSRGGLAKLREGWRIVRRHSRRTFPPVLVIQGGGTVYRMARRALGLPALTCRRSFVIRCARRMLGPVMEAGRFPWEREDPALRRPAPPAGSIGAGALRARPLGEANP
jgi:glycosyltransferase involved in cell wall biosynthesis